MALSSYAAHSAGVPGSHVFPASNRLRPNRLGCRAHGLAQPIHFGFPLFVLLLDALWVFIR